MTQKTAPTKTDKAKIIAKATDWLRHNSEKNAAARAEKKASEELAKMTAGYSEPVNVKIDEKTTLNIGVIEDESEIIDVKKLFELYPEKFWSIVTATKSAVTEVLGERAVIEVSVVTSKDKFKIEKCK